MAIRLKPNLSKLDNNLELINGSLLMVDNYIRGAIQNLNQSYYSFWNLPDDEILEILNYLGPAGAIEMFEIHYKHATALNSIMDDRELTGDRAICVRGRDITLDANGLFIFVPVEESI